MSELPPPLPDASPGAHRNRRTWLIVFGVFEVFGGVVCALTVPMTLIGNLAVAKQHSAPLAWSALLPTMLALAGLSAGVVTLGIGSILARRWARALWLIAGWAGLIGGLFGMAAILMTLGGLEEAMLEQARQQGREMPALAVQVAQVMMIVTTALLYIVVPVALILFYRSPHVKRTCELLDPTPRWTDRAPLPIIAASTLTALGAAGGIFMPGFGGALPVFGHALLGWPARLAWLGVGLVLLYVARGLYRLEYRAWKLWAIVVVVMTANYAVSLARLGFEGYLRATGLPDWQVQQALLNPVFAERTSWVSFVGIIPFVAFIAYVRRYFVTAKRPLAAV